MPLLEVLSEKTEIVLLPGSIPMVLAEVKGGAFMMGNDDSEYDSEKTADTVHVRDFYIGQYLVTNEQYAIFLNSYGCEKVLSGIFEDQFMIYEHEWGCQHKNGHWIPSYGFEQHPVINVTWHGAYEFCNWLEKCNVDKYSLPSESQWEYAALGGQKGNGLPYAGSHKLKEVGWYDLNSHSELKSVGLKKPNELGLYDMSGNVGEWCQDHWLPFVNHIPKDGSPWLDSLETHNPEAERVYRGGSWKFTDLGCRVSYRDGASAYYRSNFMSFRVVRY